MRMIAASKLVVDYSLYPRAEIDSQHVHYIREALRAGTKLPPIIIDKKTKRIVDGVHRHRAYQLEYGEHHKVEVVEKVYQTEKDIFLDAMRLNATHGRMLTTFDRAHCIIHADDLGIEPEQIASALNITVDAVGELRVNRIGKLTAMRKGGNGQAIPIKRTIRHKRGSTLTQEQYDVNDKLSGMNQSFYVNQIIMLIESDLLDSDNDYLMERLRKLHDLLDGVLAVA